MLKSILIEILLKYSNFSDFMFSRGGPPGI